MRAPLPYRYAQITEPAVRSALYARIIDEGIADYAMSARQLDESGWLELTQPAPGNILLASVDCLGHYHGTALFTKRDYNMWLFDFTSFRAGFHRAAEQARGAFAWIFGQANASCIYGVTPVQFRHAWRLAEACGFEIVTRLPGACWLARKQRFVDGVMVMCTPQTLRIAQKGA